MSGIDKPWAKSLASAVTMLRALSGMSLREYAKHLGFSPATLSRIERGYGCDLDKLVTIHQITKVKYEILLGEAK
jgi:transcriptional regulator with XRE-family HTH domain